VASFAGCGLSRALLTSPLQLRLRASEDPRGDVCQPEIRNGRSDALAESPDSVVETGLAGRGGGNRLGWERGGGKSLSSFGNWTEQP